MQKTIRDLTILGFFVLIITLLVWLPHLLSLSNFWGLNFSSGFNTIFRNFDGLEYVIIAKSFYNPSIIATIPQSQQPIYYASHFPGYSILIALFAPMLGYLKSMLFVSVLSTTLAVWAFYLFINRLKLSSQPFFLSCLFLILPARWVIVHSVGSSEPLFIFLLISTLYFFIRFEQKGHFTDIILSVVFGFLAQITRPPGILLFIGLIFYILFRIFQQNKTLGFNKAWLNHLKYLPLILMPIGLLAIFYLYGQTLGDFWAYFHSGDNIHLTFPPFQIFNKYQFWVGDIWLEDAIYIFILGFLGAVYLWKKRLYQISFVVLIYLLASTFVAHRDISRYLLPISPFILIAFEKVLVSREFKIILPIIVLAIYLYSQNFLLSNVAPIPNPQLFN